MKVIATEIPEVLLIEPDIFGDDRGFFYETYHRDRYHRAGIRMDFVQDNLSHSQKNVLRGLHYQWPHPQAKLVQVLEGEVLDVAVDIRRGSPTFGQSVSRILSSDNKHQLFIPEGFAHGFFVVSETTLFMYKCSDFYNPSSEKGILYSDPDLTIGWPAATPTLSQKDTVFPLLANLSNEDLPRYEMP